MVDSIAAESLCGNCQVSKPRTDQYFRPLQSGLSSTCTTCLEPKSRKRKANQLTVSRPQSQEVSRCGSCRVSKPRTNEYFRPLQSGLSSTCTACLDSRSRKREANQLTAPRPPRQEVSRCGSCRFSMPRTNQYFKLLQSRLSSTCTACLESRSRKWKANQPEQQSRRAKLPGGQSVDVVAPRPQRQEVGTRWNDSQLSQRTKNYQQDQRTRDRDARLRARNGQPPRPMVEDATDEDDMPGYLMSRFQGLNRLRVYCLNRRLILRGL